MLTGNREVNEIYYKYKNLVLKVAYEYSGDDYDAAQDITQETFLKLYRDFDRLKNGNVYGWLKVTARNTAINYRKKNSREVLEGASEEESPVVRGDDPRLLHECPAERCGRHVGHKDRSASGHADQSEELDPEDIRCRI